MGRRAGARIVARTARECAFRRRLTEDSTLDTFPVCGLIGKITHVVGSGEYEGATYRMGPGAEGCEVRLMRCEQRCDPAACRMAREDDARPYAEPWRSNHAMAAATSLAAPRASASGYRRYDGTATATSSSASAAPALVVAAVARHKCSAVNKDDERRFAMVAREAQIEPMLC